MYKTYVTIDFKSGQTFIKTLNLKLIEILYSLNHGFPNGGDLSKLGGVRGGELKILDNFKT